VPGKTRGGGTPTSPQGHRDEAALTRTLDMVSHEAAIREDLQQARDEVHQHHAANVRHGRNLLRLIDSIELGLGHHIDCVDRILTHATRARDLDDQRIYGDKRVTA